jgi:hypothetical protein
MMDIVLVHFTIVVTRKLVRTFTTLQADLNRNRKYRGDGTAMFVLLTIYRLAATEPFLPWMDPSIFCHQIVPDR